LVVLKSNEHECALTQQLQHAKAFSGQEQKGSSATEKVKGTKSVSCTAV
jgi:hypothetical protein